MPNNHTKSAHSVTESESVNGAKNHGHVGKKVVIFGGCVEDIIAKIGAKNVARSSNPGLCVYVCMYVCMYVCVYVWDLVLCIHVCMHVCTHVCIIHSPHMPS